MGGMIVCKRFRLGCLRDHRLRAFRAADIAMGAFGLCQVQCWKLFELVRQRSPADYRAKRASLQRYQLAMRSFS
ncbi:hypothetical protein, partial [Burkholderia gladioli]|uniref:hypothetical protein n=3 Tax=Burkholderia gladioli TaxID=28095 RepID=UPI0022D13677